MTLTIVPDVETAIVLFNEQSPRFVASLISSDDAEHRRFFASIFAPFVGNGFTRWVDGSARPSTNPSLVCRTGSAAVFSGEGDPHRRIGVQSSAAYHSE